MLLLFYAFLTFFFTKNSISFCLADRISFWSIRRKAANKQKNKLGIRNITENKSPGHHVGTNSQSMETRGRILTSIVL